MYFLLCGQQGESDDDDEHPLTQEAEIPGGVLSSHGGDVGLVDEHGACHDAQEPQDVDEAGGRHLHLLAYIGGE